MKKRLKMSTVIGILILIGTAIVIGLIGYRVVIKSGELPGKLVSLSSAADNLYYSQSASEVKTMSRIQKVDYDTMKYGYLDDVHLAQMDYLDSYYEEQQMEEIRKKNDVVAMENWSSGMLAYEDAKKQQEEDAKRAIAQAEAAAAAAEAARHERVQQIAASILQRDLNGGTIDVGDSSDLGSGATASNGGAIGERILADHHGASLGIFSITAYCTCRVCCGVYSGRNRTASGTVPTSNRTVAVDTSVIPFGTRLVINGQVYVAEDVGGAIKGNHIDMFFYTHAEAVRWGRRSMEVFLYD